MHRWVVVQPPSCFVKHLQGEIITYTIHTGLTKLLTMITFSVVHVHHVFVRWVVVENNKHCTFVLNFAKLLDTPFNNSSDCLMRAGFAQFVWSSFRVR